MGRMHFKRTYVRACRCAFKKKEELVQTRHIMTIRENAIYTPKSKETQGEAEQNDSSKSGGAGISKGLMSKHKVQMLKVHKHKVQQQKVQNIL